ncbi:hypothetical protein EPN52_13945 [bacterium]|nr:MAG: hypothetical protein EPN52_13945 [bacterium]
MNLLEGLDGAQRDAVEAPLDDALLVIGATGSGKSEVLARRAARAAAHARGVLVIAHGEGARARLAARLRALDCESVSVRRFDDLPLLLAGRATLAHVEAARIFEHCIEPLFALAWPEFERGELDPEQPGLSWPEHFRDDALALILKLHDAGIAPPAFLEGARAGAEAFYGRVHVELDAQTLAAQRGRELELAAVLARLYEAFLEATAQARTVTAATLYADLAARMQADDALARSHRLAYPLCLVDDAHACRARELELLRSLYGAELHGVTLAAAEAIDGLVTTLATVRLEHAHRAPSRPRATLYRGTDAADEASFVADRIAALARERDISLGEIAVVARDIRGTAAVAAALTTRGLPYQYLGSTSLFDDATVLDVLALAGAAWNPHDAVRMLRALQVPPIALSDASIYRLCGAPPGPQTALFEELERTERGARRAERGERLARNVLEGLVDEQLSEAARARVRTLRAALLRWRAWAQECALDVLLARIADESGMAAWIAGGPGVQARHQRRQLSRLLSQARAFALAHPGAGIDAFLHEADDLAERDVDLPHDLPLEPDAVALLAAEETYGREFEALFAIGAQAGSFPRYYSPPSFYYSPRYGLIARENVADGGEAQTAKYAWYSAKQRVAEKYYARERSLFMAVLARARSLLFVTAHGRATRALRNPELLEELRRVQSAQTRTLE